MILMDFASWWNGWITILIRRHLGPFEQQFLTTQDGSQKYGLHRQNTPTVWDGQGWRGLTMLFGNRRARGVCFAGWSRGGRLTSHEIFGIKDLFFPINSLVHILINGRFCPAQPQCSMLGVWFFARNWFVREQYSDQKHRNIVNLWCRCHDFTFCFKLVWPMMHVWPRSLADPSCWGFNPKKMTRNDHSQIRHRKRRHRVTGFTPKVLCIRKS